MQWTGYLWIENFKHDDILKKSFLRFKENRRKDTSIFYMKPDWTRLVISKNWLLMSEKFETKRCWRTKIVIIIPGLWKKERDVEILAQNQIEPVWSFKWTGYLWRKNLSPIDIETRIVNIIWNEWKKTKNIKIFIWHKTEPVQSFETERYWKKNCFNNFRDKKEIWIHQNIERKPDWTSLVIPMN